MLQPLLLEIAAVVLACCLLGGVTIVGRTRLATFASEFRPRLRESGPYLLVLGVLLLINSALRDLTEGFSLFVGWNITGGIEAIEGGFVAVIQSFQTELLTTYFSYIYVHGYVVLLVFPLFAYLVLRDQTRFRQLVVAYGLNYVLGTVLYIAFIAFGPRNVGLVDGLLYTTFPQFQFLTTEINNPTNVFPSLHTSLSATAAIFAYKTRDIYRAWFPIALGLAGSVIISTMYLGIHWAIDVVAGLVLAAACVYGAERFVANSDRWLATRLKRIFKLPYIGPRIETVVVAVGGTAWLAHDEETEPTVESGSD